MILKYNVKKIIIIIILKTEQPLWCHPKRIFWAAYFLFFIFSKINEICGWSFD